MSASPAPSADDLARIVAELFSREHSARLPASIDVQALAVALGSSYEAGLPSSLVAARRLRMGANEVPVKSMPSLCELILEALRDPTMIMLLAAATVSAFIYASGLNTDEQGSIFESVTIMASVIIVVLVQAITNFKKAETFALQQHSLDAKLMCWVLRDAALKQIHPRELVVGDIVRLSVGVVAPTDCLLMPRSSNLRIDESALTGESRLIDKWPVSSPLVVSGTSVINGDALCLVIAVGTRSTAGRILAALNEDPEDNDEFETGSALLSRLNTLAEQIGKVGMTAAAMVFMALLFRRAVHRWSFPNEPLWDEVSHVLNAFMLATTVLVVAVPEGLPLASTLALAFSLRALNEAGVQVKHLDSCETMGCCTTICSDKTGTLTENKMRVVDCTALNRSPRMLNKVGECSVLACAPDASATRVASSWTYTGNPTEAALLRFAVEVCGTSVDLTRSQHRVVAQIPFSSSRKMMSVTTVSAAGRVMYAKGAPSVLLPLCTFRFSDDGKSFLPINRESVDSELKAMERRALRVIATASRVVTGEGDMAEAGFTLIGLVGIEDPLRPGVPAAVEKFTRAGVVVRMVTGDSLETAIAVGRQALILRGPAKAPVHSPQVMTGAEFAERVFRIDTKSPMVARRMFNKAEGKEDFGLAPAFLLDASNHPILDMNKFDEVWPRLRVLARCLPEDKLALVKGIKASKLYRRDPSTFPGAQLVAVTGDGTNDAPALRAADVGFAMGVMGTEVARQACDIVLLDDDFSSTVHALVWGRNVEAAVTKFISFQLTVNVVAMILAVGGSILSAHSPLSSVQMLWLNLIMDTLGGLALASEKPNEEALLSRTPLPRQASLLRSVTVSIVGQALYQLVVLSALSAFLSENGDRERSLVFNAFVLMQLANEVNARSTTGSLYERFRPSTWFLGVWVFCLSVQWLIVQVGRDFFATEALSVSDWTLCIGLAVPCWLWQLVLDRISLRSEPAVQDQLWLRAQRSYGTLTEAEVDEAGVSRTDAKRRWRMVRNAIRFSNAAKKPRPCASLGAVSPHQRSKLQKVASKVLRLDPINAGGD